MSKLRKKNSKYVTENKQMENQDFDRGANSNECKQ